MIATLQGVTVEFLRRTQTLREWYVGGLRQLHSDYQSLNGPLWSWNKWDRERVKVSWCPQNNGYENELNEEVTTIIWNKYFSPNSADIYGQSRINQIEFEIHKNMMSTNKREGGILRHLCQEELDHDCICRTSGSFRASLYWR